MVNESKKRLIREGGRRAAKKTKDGFFGPLNLGKVLVVEGGEAPGTKIGILVNCHVIPPSGGERGDHTMGEEQRDLSRRSNDFRSDSSMDVRTELKGKAATADLQKGKKRRNRNPKKTGRALERHSTEEEKKGGGGHNPQKQRICGEGRGEKKRADLEKNSPGQQERKGLNKGSDLDKKRKQKSVIRERGLRLTYGKGDPKRGGGRMSNFGFMGDTLDIMQRLSRKGEGREKNKKEERARIPKRTRGGRRGKGSGGERKKCEWRTKLFGEKCKRKNRKGRKAAREELRGWL